MRHQHRGHKLGVNNDRRTGLVRSLTLALIEHDQIRTTPSRAKGIRRQAERIITFAKRGDVHGRRQIVKFLGSSETNIPGENRVRNAIEKVYSELVPRFKDRAGGYTQMFRLAPRRPGDNAEMCLFRYLPGEEKAGQKKDKAPKKPTKKEPKKVEAAAPTAKESKKEKRAEEPQDKKDTKAKAKKKDK
jgi:large subunit ribosomal protein L17